MRKIILRQLTTDFYAENGHLKEILDKMDDGTIKDKGRGYGVLLVDILGYRFAIPLRSEMKHKNNFPTKIYKNTKGETVRKGLDYTKAVIIKEERYISTKTFIIPKSEFIKISKSEKSIINSFNKYVSRYIKAVTNGDKNILNDSYKYSTLQNYHKELGLIVENQKSQILT